MIWAALALLVVVLVALSMAVESMAVEVQRVLDRPRTLALRGQPGRGGLGDVRHRGGRAGELRPARRRPARADAPGLPPGPVRSGLPEPDAAVLRRGQDAAPARRRAPRADVQQPDTLRAVLAHGPIVAIERCPDLASVAACRRLGVPAVIGDANSPDRRVLRKAGCARAARVIGLLREDKANVEFVLRVPQDMAERGTRRTRPDDGDADDRIIAQVNEPHLARRLEAYEKIAEYSRADVRLHNIHAIQAQRLRLQDPPDVTADLFGQPAPHFVLCGFGRLRRQLFAEAARRWRSCIRLPDEPVSGRGPTPLERPRHASACTTAAISASLRRSVSGSRS